MHNVYSSYTPWQQAHPQQAVLYKMFLENAAKCDLYKISQLYRVRNCSLEQLSKSIQKVISDLPVLSARFRCSSDVVEVCFAHGYTPFIQQNPDSGKLLPHQFTCSDLEQSELVKVSVSPGEGCCWFILSIHHIVCDAHTLAWIEARLEKELIGKLETSTASADLASYQAYTDEVIAWHDSEERMAQLSFWRDRLMDYQSAVSLVNLEKQIDRADDAAFSYEFQLEEPVLNQFNHIVESAEVTPFVLMLALSEIFIARYFDQETFILNTSLDQRGYWNSSADVGLYSSYFPVCCHVKPERYFGDLLVQTRDDFYEGLINGKVSLYDLIVESGVDVTRASVLLEFTESTGVHGTLEYLCSFNEKIDFPLVISVCRTASSLNIKVMGRADHYQHESTFHGMCLALQQLIEKTLSHPNVNVAINRVNDDIYQKTEEQLSFRSQPSHLIREFEKVVEKHSQCPAIRFEHEVYTFDWLNKKANTIARTLINTFEIQPQATICILMERSVFLLPIIIGILKTRAQYVPLSPYDGEARLCSQLELTQPDLVITSPVFEGMLYGLCAERTVTDRALFESDESSANLVLAYSPEDIAYTIFTSGSTGLPKGVVVPHQGITHTVLYRQHYYGLDASDVILQYPSVFYDSAVNDYFSTLLSGASLVLFSDSDRNDVVALARLIKSHKVTHFMMVPAIYLALLESHSGSLKGVRQVVLCGDTLSMSLIQFHQKSLPDTEVYNEYGPAETSVWSTVYQFGPEDDEVLIGKGIAHHLVDIIHPKWGLCFDNEVGEICVSGPGLAQGYLRNPVVTDEKFVAHPIHGKRMYRTGDLASRNAAGELRFVGRGDNLVKIAGAGVELEEVERIIAETLSVNRFHLVYVEEGDNIGSLLCLYEQGTNTGLLNRDRLLTFLPARMVPAHYHDVAEIPLSVNGKVDRKGLKRIAQVYLSTLNQATVITPADKIQKIWRKTLGNLEICDTTCLYELGASSMDFIQLSKDLNDTLTNPIPLKELMKSSTFKEWLSLYETATEVNQLHLTDSDIWSASSSACRFLVTSLLQQDKSIFNILDYWKLDREFPVADLRQACQAVIRQHDVLSSTFLLEKGRITRKSVAVDIDQVYQELEIQDSTLEEMLNRIFRRSLSLTTQLFQFYLLQHGTERYFVMLIHHAIADVFSIDRIMADIERHSFASGTPESRYSETRSEQHVVGARSLREAEQYWTQSPTGGEAYLLKLPTDFPREQKNGEGSVCHHVLSDFRGDVASAAQHYRTTEFSVLSSALAMMLSDITQSSQVSFGFPYNIRRLLSSEEVGCFLNPIPVAMDIAAYTSTDQVIQAVSETLADSMAYGAYPFERIVSSKGIKWPKGRFPLFDVGLTLESLDTPEMPSSRYMMKQSFTPTRVFSQNDFWFYINLEQDDIVLDVLFDTSLYREESIAHFVKVFSRKLHEIVSFNQV
ncbi:amino acid adenylation domain-containing protein [Vibrio aquimaris]|uniref:Plipastatin synthase subunit B n=1 Tax=Vibrio aquimaris TaxID=2587862 RepID=A0A5P9CM58_9VIBR|nr:amino acid adenylation domain-containing protein [Vibrio aquimaris]QFT27310.1 Plipastatin synthase subunit B [Vibrio aquimaris]